MDTKRSEAVRRLLAEAEQDRDVCQAPSLAHWYAGEAAIYREMLKRVLENESRRDRQETKRRAA